MKGEPEVYTGIVEELGSVVELTPLPDAARLAIRGDIVSADLKPGDSIAVNGVCLTVVDVVVDDGNGGGFTAEVMKETLDRCSLGGLGPGDPVNLERPATLTTRLGGHLVQGHVDGVGSVLSRRADQHWEVVTISLPPQLARYVVEKGSITVDGVSLTVAAVTDLDFSISLIPTTLRMTTLGRRAAGDPVNLEVDVIAKYVEKLVTLS